MVWFCYLEATQPERSWFIQSSDSCTRNSYVTFSCAPISRKLIKETCHKRLWIKYGYNIHQFRLKIRFLIIKTVRYWRKKPKTTTATTTKKTPPRYLGCLWSWWGHRRECMIWWWGYLWGFSQSWPLLKTTQARTSFSTSLWKPVDPLGSTGAQNFLFYFHDIVGFFIWSFMHLISKLIKYPTKWLNSGTSWWANSSVE